MVAIYKYGTCHGSPPSLFDRDWEQSRFCDKVNEYIEKLSPAEIKLMHALTNYDIIIAKQYSQETCLINHLKERR